MVTQFLNDSSDIQPTHPIMISKIHVTLPFTSSDFLPYRFPPTALFNLGRLGAFSVPQEASSEHLLAPPATWEVLGAGPTSITAEKTQKLMVFYCKNCQENIHWGMMFLKILSQIKSKIWDIHQCLKYLLINVNQTLYFFMDSMNCIFLRRKKLEKITRIYQPAATHIFHFVVSIGALDFTTNFVKKSWFEAAEGYLIRGKAAKETALRFGASHSQPWWLFWCPNAMRPKIKPMPPAANTVWERQEMPFSFDVLADVCRKPKPTGSWKPHHFIGF